MSQFQNIYRHGMARIAVGMPRCRIADPLFNVDQMIKIIDDAKVESPAIIAFPELGISAYTCDDLFHQRALLDACLAALLSLICHSRSHRSVVVAGAPLRIEHRLFNCAVVIHAGKILGVVPKTYIPNYGEFYEVRQFCSGDDLVAKAFSLCGQEVPFGSKLIFSALDVPFFDLHVELCEDLWTPIPPSSYASLAGATVLVNLSASNITVGKAEYRRRLVSQQSARCLAVYVYTSAGSGESSNDMAWDGQSLVYEDGELIGESPRFVKESHVLFADVDLERVSRERMRQTSFGQSVRLHAHEVSRFRRIEFTMGIDLDKKIPLQRGIARFPYVPSYRSDRVARCNEVYNIQVQALLQRLRSSGVDKLVIGISGGLDSTHALLVCAHAIDKLGLPRANILAYTMPGFATSTRTLQQARSLMEMIGCSAGEIDIRPSCEQMFRDIGHPFAKGTPQHDITFENVQAGERTSHLFRLANLHRGIVIGTGDLSELALGWCTYGVGDHMSHYNVNASVPKTLIRYLVRWAAESDVFGQQGKNVLEEILDTEISPELIPAKQGQVIQSTESILGPYELQDFNLYYTLRFGFTPEKIGFLAHAAWSDKNKGEWPEEPNARRNQYDMGLIKSALNIFVSRFFHGSQFKRSCVPNSPKIGSGGSLSPRGDWRAPSDSEATVWLKSLENIPSNLD